MLQINFTNALLPIEVASVGLNQTRKQTLAMIAARELSWCFDLALESRSEIRVLAQELARIQGHASRVPDFTTAVKLIFPDAPQARLAVIAKLPLSVVARRLAVSSDHALGLMREGWLEAVSNTRCRRGPGGSPEVTFASVVDFLKRRRIA